MSSILTGINRAFVYADTSGNIFDEHVDSLFKLVHNASFGKSAQTLLLLFQISQEKASLRDRFFRALYVKLLDAELLHTAKQSFFLNVLYKSVKADTNIERICAILKRLLQVSAAHQPGFVCGVLLLIAELCKTHTALRGQMSRFHRGAEGEHYDMRTVQPEHSHAANATWWELSALVEHWHPSVAKYAEMLLNSENVEHAGDPIEDFSLAAFLDKFVYETEFFVFVLFAC